MLDDDKTKKDEAEDDSVEEETATDTAVVAEPEEEVKEETDTEAKDEVEEKSTEEAEALKGATVLEPEKGLHSEGCVLILDFQSLYPNIMKTYNVSPDTLVASATENKTHKSPTGAEFLDAEEKEGILLFVEKDGILELADDTRDVSLESVIASMAAHEVRHRVQKHLKPGLFEPALVREFNLDLLANVRFVAGLLFLEMKERYVMEKQSGGYIKARINRIEFDATVVQIMALQIFHRSHSL